MPLRSLLGYEPSQARGHEDYGGRFISFTPARSVIATKKAKYQAPMGRLQKLPPIDEESTPAATPRLRRRTEPTITRLPKRTFLNQRIIEVEPAKPVPVVPVRPIPREREEPVHDFEKFEKKMEEKYVFKHRTAYADDPKNINHTMVDGLVADYLHYARYGHVIPVYEGTSATACPCCTGRNKENVRTLLGLPKGVAKPQPQKYDRQSKLRDQLRDAEDVDEDARMFPNSLYAFERKKTKHKQEITPAEKQRQQIAAHSQRLSWMNYQPLPYASNYLNTEFNRPSLTSDLLAVEAQRANMQTTDTIIEANSNYDFAMNKLESLAFGRSSYSQDYH